MRLKRSTPPNVGSARSPLRVDENFVVYRRRGKWHYRNLDTKARFGDRFVEAKDPGWILEMISRNYHVIYPAHECADRPNLPCPACEMDGLRALGIKSKKRLFDLL
jgi:hypothetical protein